MTANRRQFLAGSALATAGLPFVRPAPSWLPGRPRGNGQILVIVQCEGAYDYLNMIVPADHPNYIQGRPNLRIPRASCLTLAAGATHYWAPALLPFKTLFDRGDLAIVHNVGYPNPNLSHFESEKKWYAGDPTATVLQRGWLARWLDIRTGTASIPAVDIEARMNDAFSGQRVPVMTDLSAFAYTADPSSAQDNQLELALIQQNAAVLRPTADPQLRYVADATVAATQDSQAIQQAAAGYTPAVTYPNSQLAERLQLAAGLITGGLGAEVYVCDRGGFDTHANEAVAGNPGAGNLANLLTDLSGSILAFLDDIAAHAMGQQVVVMVFSEFGRRVFENGSLGTEHGHGGVAFLAGAPVVGGQYGNFPDLNPATNAQYYVPFDGLSTDFRSLYATVLERWLGVPSVPVLGSQFPLLGAL